MVHDYPWLMRDAETYKNILANVVNYGLYTMGACQRLWDRVPDEQTFGDIDWTVHRMSDEQANFRHPANDKYDAETDRIVESILRRHGHEPSGEFRRSNLRGLKVVDHCNGSMQWFRWGWELGAPTLHVRALPDDELFKIVDTIYDVMPGRWLRADDVQGHARAVR